MTKRKRNQILNLGSFANLKTGRKSKKPCYNSGENLLNREDEQENVRENTIVLFTLINSNNIDSTSVPGAEHAGPSRDWIRHRGLSWK